MTPALTESQPTDENPPKKSSVVVCIKMRIGP